MAPHRRYNGVESFPAQSPRRHAQVAAVRAERERALVHVQHNQQPVGNQKLFVGP